MRRSIELPLRAATAQSHEIDAFRDFRNLAARERHTNKIQAIDQYVGGSRYQVLELDQPTITIDQPFRYQVPEKKVMARCIIVFDMSARPRFSVPLSQQEFSR